MIRAAIASLAGTWIARDAAKGNIPDSLTVPLTLLATRLPAPALIAGAIGYGIYRLTVEARANRAKDVTPKRRTKKTGAKSTKRSPATRAGKRRPSSSG
jgi:hypothetical protein